MHRGFAYRLEPTAAQAEILTQWIGATRLTYNLCLEQRRDFWRQYRRSTGGQLNWIAQAREVTALRADVDWIAAVPRNTLDQAVRDLDSAFLAFFSGRARYPTPRKRGRNDAIRFKGVDISVRRLNARWSAVCLPKLGLVKFRDTRPRGTIVNATVSLSAGRWCVAFTCDAGEPKTENHLPSVGIDRGVVAAFSLSTGEKFAVPARIAEIGRRRRRAQRVLARRKRGSARYRLQKARVAALTAREARIRKDWLHRVSTDVSRRFGVVALEDLKIRNMTASAAGTVAAPGRNVAAKRSLNRAILAQGWGQLQTMLAYKLEAAGGRLVLVPAPYTSQTCSACGVIDAASRENQAAFSCIHCGHRDNADTNAAINIRRSASGLGVEGPHFGPAEASIMVAYAA